MKNIIKKILKEETNGRTRLEMSVIELIDQEVDISNLSDNYYGVAVDIIKSNYGRTECVVTFLFKKPFKEKESDLLYRKSRNVKEVINSFLPDLFYNIQFSNSTIESYMNHKKYYDTKKWTYKKL